MKQKKCSNRTFSSDKFQKDLWNTMVRDFRSVMGGSLCLRQEQALNTCIKDYRTVSWPGKFNSSPALFKRIYQLENLHKRYRFADDAFTDEELEDKAIKRFIATQVRISQPRGQRSQKTHLVLQEARRICREILGEYDTEEHASLCQFGKRATVGCSAHKSYLDLKLEGPITGSREHIRWFKNYLQTDKLLSDVLAQRPQGPCYVVCDTLALTNVPKSWKARRGIMPNTLIGSFYSYGLGKMIQNRLELNAKLDIRKLQKVHGFKVKRFSKTRSHATVDATEASDSYVYETLCAILPRKWLHACNFGRIRHCTIGDKKIYMSTFMTMGIGFTFPLQTLVFYSICQAVKNLLNVKTGKVSVYGDDIIYPSEIHQYVVPVLKELHFGVNHDKTFVHSHFRESCGSDYYHGVDVRPFQPEGSAQMLSGRLYVLMLYKTLNGLLRRWDSLEIPQTLRFLYSEILRVDLTILQVPPHFPDYSGLKVDSITKIGNTDLSVPWNDVCFSRKQYAFTFAYYKMFPQNRVVPTQIAYLWDELRGISHRILKHNVPLDQNMPLGLFCSFEDAMNNIDCGRFCAPYKRLDDSTKLRWQKVIPAPRNYRSSLTRKRLKKLEPVVALKGRMKVIRQTGSTSQWNYEALK